MTKESKQELINWFLNDMIESFEDSMKKVDTGKYADEDYTFKYGWLHAEIKYQIDRIKRQLNKGSLFDLDNIEEDPDNE